jgi:hypothetical protein
VSSKRLASALRFEQREPCKSCPYRTDAPLELWSPEEFEDLLQKDRSRMGTIYGCHKARHQPAEDAQVCVGWLINQRERGIPSIALRLKLMSDPAAVGCLNEASSPVPLYESIEEMCEANGVEP